ncbi:MAG: hypothetical protein LBJ86_07825 [Spirochaetaceae bacterium]|nr:hypothetical protein [Spirochaetaceae bacterium]
MKKCWRVPAKQNAAFAAAMEDVLAACHRPCDERKPVVCMDEQPVQLPGEKREPIPMNEHHSKREDNEYVRKGTCGVFMFVEPLGGRRYAAASERRTKQDWAREAFEIAQRLETRYTPKHGSRLNIAEIELSAMTSQCLNRWIDTLDKLNREVTAWQNDRNRNQKTVKWQFTAEDARIKLHGLYPVI